MLSQKKHTAPGEEILVARRRVEIEHLRLGAGPRLRRRFMRLHLLPGTTGAPIPRQDQRFFGESRC